MDFFKQNIIPAEVIVQLTAFVIVFLTLKKLAWGPIQKALETRRETIREDHEKIESARKQVELLQADYAGRLQKIEEEARLKMQESIDEGRRLARDIQEKARAEAQVMFDKTKQNLDLEVAKARLELKQTVAKISIQVAERILGEALNDAKQQDKIMGMIGDIETGSRA